MPELFHSGMLAFISTLSFFNIHCNIHTDYPCVFVFLDIGIRFYIYVHCAIRLLPSELNEIRHTLLFQVAFLVI